ncbi:MAG TPA: hypothetical protein VJN93_17590 [Candidatus Acidoferrum sp.]|nr:hypothetical protein [Candidatus Acidoferrum sp.]
MTLSRLARPLGIPLLLSVFFAANLFAQAAAAPAQDSSQTRLNDIIRETQKQLGGKNLAGLVWWVPAEFWEQSAIEQGSSPQKARETFAALRQYTVVIVLAGKIGLGNINWYSQSEILSGTSLRDADGQLYKPISDISPDAQGLSSIIKPVMANILGPAGQNLQILFFASRNAKGVAIADPTREGSFSVLLDGLGSSAPSVYEWRLPLTSMTPPRFCPVGSERMEASWKFCPWHGTKLTAIAPPPAEPPSKPDKPL